MNFSKAARHSGKGGMVYSFALNDKPSAPVRGRRLIKPGRILLKCLANSLFVFIGAEPDTDWLAGVVERDERGFILTGADLLRDGKRPQGWPLDRDPYWTETSVPGIFAAGDVRHGSVKRVASGVGEGSIAVQFIHQYLSAV